MYALGLSVGLAAALGVQAALVSRRFLPTAISRKVGHVALGTGLSLSLLGYGETASARWWAALPFAVALALFFLVGSGRFGGDALRRAASRSGAAREFLFGPALFVVAAAACLLGFWRSSPVGLTAVSVLVFGDGLAEPVGRRFPSPRLPWNAEKSVAGSLTVLLAGALGALGLLGLFAWAGFVRQPVTELVLGVLIVSAFGAAAESLPLGPWDNGLVPLACVAAGAVVF